ncbi:MAG: class I adenylate-forming enzyme family protein [Acidimicrobiales bacterium]
MLGDVVDEAAARFGDATAYVAADGWSLSYRELADRSRAVAAGMRRLGVTEGDVVALVLPTAPEHVVAYVAAARLGAITAGVNTRLTAPERAAVLTRAEPRLVLATPDLAPTAAAVPVAELVEVTEADGAGALLAGLDRPDLADDLPSLRPDPDRPVAIVFTSGTTGTPKGAVFCQRQLDAITGIDTGHRWAEAPGGASLSATSLAHLGPTTKLAGTLHRGGSIVLVRRWRAAEALELTERHRMASVAGIPTQIALMLRHPDFDRRDLSSVRAIVMGGGPATPALVREARRRFGAAVATRYSCTEAGIGLGTAFDDPPEDAEETVGRPHPGVELTLVVPGDPEATPVPVGEVGEVCLRSAAVMSGYWRDPEATVAAFTPAGAVRTGDLGWLDDRGRLHLAGRAKEMYVRGGYNVYPQAVEAVLVEHPGVAEVAVVPRPDDVMGEVGVAVVVPADPAHAPTLDDLRAVAGDRLARHELPEAIVVTDALPLTAMEKVDRRSLARRVARSADAG